MISKDVFFVCLLSVLCICGSWISDVKLYETFPFMDLSFVNFNRDDSDDDKVLPGFLIKEKRYILFDVAILFLGIYLTEIKIQACFYILHKEVYFCVVQSVKKLRIEWMLFVRELDKLFHHFHQMFAGTKKCELEL